MAGRRIRNTAVGRVLLVQENRFRLLRANGQCLLLTLGSDVRSDAADLAGWHQAGVPVVVHYTGEANLETGIAHALEPLTEEGPTWEA